MADRGGDERIEVIRERLATLEGEQWSLKNELVSLERRLRTAADYDGAATAITAASPASQKIDLFRRLFAGREDVFPLRWQNRKTGKSGYAPACSNEWKPGVCRKPEVKCGECPNQAFVAVSDDIIRRHLRGHRGAPSSNRDFVAGVYPLLADSTCHFVAVDFDDDDWRLDATAYLETCRKMNVTAALERSRSGSGGHVWIFFAEPIPATLGRQLASFLLTETMERRPEIGSASYDRLFPSQDTIPTGGFGNLRALPLQYRARQHGNSVFVDLDLQPYADQWTFLSTLRPNSRADVEAIVESAVATGRVVGVRMPMDDDHADQPWLAAPSRRPPEPPIVAPLPRSIEIVLADGVYVDRTELPPAMVARLARLAAFQNPEFFRAQAMRLSTHGKPRIISCAELHPRHLALPRGCLNEAIELLESYHVGTQVVDKREVGAPLNIRFTGSLREEQALATSALAHHESGVLAAATAFGKTVVAAALIAERACSTLVLVDRRELLAQWVERLAAFLSIDPSDIGVIGGGRRKPTTKIDVAAEAHQRGFEHHVALRDTGLQLPISAGEPVPSISEVYRALASDPARTALIVDDIRQAVANGRSPLVLTERLDHLENLAIHLREILDDVVVLRGGMKTSERRAAHLTLRETGHQPRIVLSTGRYLGEGFDDSRLDALFLAMPIAWKGTLAQYVGRLHREHEGKRDVVVYDYVDGLVPMLARMSAARSRWRFSDL